MLTIKNALSYCVTILLAGFFLEAHLLFAEPATRLSWNSGESVCTLAHSVRVSSDEVADAADFLKTQWMTSCRLLGEPLEQPLVQHEEKFWEVGDDSAIGLWLDRSADQRSLVVRLIDLDSHLQMTMAKASVQSSAKDSSAETFKALLTQVFEGLEFKGQIQKGRVRLWGFNASSSLADRSSSFVVYPGTIFERHFLIPTQFFMKESVKNIGVLKQTKTESARVEFELQVRASDRQRILDGDRKLWLKLSHDGQRE